MLKIFAAAAAFANCTSTKLPGREREKTLRTMEFGILDLEYVPTYGSN